VGEAKIRIIGKVSKGQMDDMDLGFHSQGFDSLVPTGGLKRESRFVSIVCAADGKIEESPPSRTMPLQI
jgi:hypothetical protein